MCLRGGQAIDVLGDLLALPALCQIGEMVEMGRIYGVGGLDDEIHVFKGGSINIRGLAYGGTCWRILFQFPIKREFSWGGLRPPDMVVGQSQTCNCFTLEMESGVLRQIVTLAGNAGAVRASRPVTGE